MKMKGKKSSIQLLNFVFIFNVTFPSPTIFLYYTSSYHSSNLWLQARYWCKALITALLKSNKISNNCASPQLINQALFYKYSFQCFKLCHIYLFIVQKWCIDGDDHWIISFVNFYERWLLHVMDNSVVALRRLCSVKYKHLRLISDWIPVISAWSFLYFQCHR